MICLPHPPTDLGSAQDYRLACCSGCVGWGAVVINPNQMALNNTGGCSCAAMIDVHQQPRR
jgi:hypothetical protein